MRTAIKNTRLRRSRVGDQQRRIRSGVARENWGSAI